MKKLTLLVAALAVSFLSFGQGKITYDLAGGVTNDYGWKNKGEMFDAFLADGGCDALLVKEGENKMYKTLDEWKKVTDPYTPICGKLTVQHMQKAFAVEDGAKWGWLKTYLQAVHTAQAGDGASALDDGVTAAAWRFSATAFFVEGQRAGWPKSADFSQAGQYSAFASAWKHGWVSPAEYAEGETVTLTTPYLEGKVFLGWFDAAGNKVAEVSGKGDVALTARWFDYYVYSCAEFAALEDNTADVYVQGTVSMVISSNVWIQDPTGGLYCFMKNNDLKVGESVILKGKKVLYGGIPEIEIAEISVRENGTAVVPVTTLISNLVATPDNFMSQLVKLEGVRVKRVANGEYTDLYLYDDNAEIYAYRLTLDATAFPDGSKVNAIAVMSKYNDKLQLRTLAENVTAASAAAVDKSVYDEKQIDGITYKLANNWIYSVNEENYIDNRPNPVAEGSRSVVYKDGILYFAYRQGNEPAIGTPYLVRVDAKTGLMLDPVKFAENIFVKETEADGVVTKTFVFGPYSDFKLDNAGHAITSNLPTAGGDFQIWMVDLATGEGSLLVDMTKTGEFLKDKYPDNTTIRIDRIGVYGDVTKDARIMAPCASAKDIYYWDIKDGKWDGNTGWFKLEMDAENLGTAPVCCPVADGYFYVDGFTTYPMLFDEDGNMVDNLGAYVETNPELLLGSNGKARAFGHNGVLEFEVNGEYFLSIAGDNTEGKGGAPSTFVLYKFKDASRNFAEMTTLWEFPANGMGTVSNPQRTATSFANVAEDGKTVDLYVYTCENGYASYTMTIQEQGDAVENVANNGVMVTVDGMTIRTSEIVDMEVFNISGQKVAAGNMNVAEVAAQGVYMVRTVNANGTSVAKVLVK